MCIITLFSCTTFLHSAQQPYDALVPLGGNCQLAWQMYCKGIRKYALPFDQTVTPFNGLYDVLKNRFENFFNVDNAELIQNGTEKYALEKKYTISFIHEFEETKDFLTDYPGIKQTYDRRVTRFLKVVEDSKNPLFIRHGINKEQAIALSALIKNKLVPNKNFLLLALDTTEEIKEPWNCPNVVNYYLKQAEPYDWEGDHEAWKDIFIKIGLKLGTKEDSRKEV